MAIFSRYIGIDYSGAETAESSLKGLRVYEADGVGEPTEVLPPPSTRKYWTRRGIAEWVVEQLSAGDPVIVGIDHGFSFPLRYFEVHGIQPDWSVFLEDFQVHWPTDSPHTYVYFIRFGDIGNGPAREGNPRWRRLTEERAPGAKSVFHFDVQGSVAKSTHAGIPWLRFIRREIGDRVHFWPFEGWEIPAGKSLVCEVYPRLWSGEFPRDDRNGDQHDAFSIAAWLSRADASGALETALQPKLSPPEAATAQVEGWILGVPSKGFSGKPRRLSQSGTSFKGTTRIGTVNRNDQEVLEKTDLPGNDHNQVVYVLLCRKCGHRYGANGSDLWQRRCPVCGGGAAGLAF